MLIDEVVVVIDIQGLVPVFVDMVRPVEFSSNNPPAILPAQNGRFSRNNVIIKQASIEPIAFVVCNQVGIRIRAGSAASENSAFRIRGLFGCFLFRAVLEIAAIEFAALREKMVSLCPQYWEDSSFNM